MSKKYVEWYDKQDSGFKDEINPHKFETTRFIDYSLRPISLDDLASLDSKHILASLDIINTQETENA